MQTSSPSCSILYIPHGGGPLPILGHEGHTDMVAFLKTIPERLGQPDAVLVISAHWEEKIPTLTAHASPPLFYDYYGFPPETYEIQYPAPGSPKLAEEIFQLLGTQGIKANLDKKRGFDHGMFIPLIFMYPDAKIPCVQLSLTADLDPSAHLALGRALSGLKNKNILILGSGFSFHNMRAFGDTLPDRKNIEFDQWLIHTCTDRNLSPEQREERLIQWEKAPHARYCHPREEHLLPLHVCAGMAGKPAEVVFNKEVLNKRATAFLWQENQS